MRQKKTKKKILFLFTFEKKGKTPPLSGCTCLIGTLADLFPTRIKCKKVRKNKNAAAVKKLIKCFSLYSLPQICFCTFFFSLLCTLLCLLPLQTGVLKPLMRTLRWKAITINPAPDCHFKRRSALVLGGICCSAGIM